MKTILFIIFLFLFSSQINSQPTWSIQNSGTTNNLNRIILKTSNNVKMLYIAGNNGTILRSSNLGLIWETVNSNTNSNLYSLEISDNDTGYAVGSGGTVIRTFDGGNTWSAMTSNTSNSLKEIRILPGSGKAIAVGENGTFLKLENNLWTFSQIDTTDLNSVSYAYFNTNRMNAVGNYGIILNTTNNGINWSRINSNTPVNLNYVSRSSYGLIIGNSGIALQISGTVINFVNTGTFSNLYFLNDRNTFVCGDNGTVLINWQPLNTNLNQRLNSIISTNDINCFVIGENGLILYAYTLNETSYAKQLYINNIRAWFRNNGSFNRDPSTGNAGFEWPNNSGKTARYASGIWMGCKSGNDTLTAVAEYSYDYRPGYVDDNGLPQGNEDPLYRIYRIDRGNTASPDYQNWPAYQGAYVNSNGTPFFLGTQTMFYCYTDAYPHGSGSTSLLSLKAQILQTNWCYTNIGLGDVEFIEFKIINRSSSSWVNAYIAFWTDDDVGNSTDDAIGCDTNLNLAYTYNITGNDPIYGEAPPAVGTKLLRSPIIATGNINDTVKYYDPPGSQRIRVRVGYKFIGMNVFNTYNNGSPQPSDPLNNTETYRVLEGKWRLGDSWINPVNNQVTKKAYSGDPVSGTGWIMTSGGDRRYLQSLGPFNMNPNDTQSIIIAQVIAKGSSNLNSITQLRSLSSYAQTIYNENFQSVLAVNNISSEIPDQYILSQNYPNPFNPVTHLEFGIPELGFVTLKVYDVIGKEVKTLVNEIKAVGKYKVEFNGSNLPSGIYFYKMEVGNFVSTKKMLLIK